MTAKLSQPLIEACIFMYFLQFCFVLLIHACCFLPKQNIQTVFCIDRDMSKTAPANNEIKQRSPYVSSYSSAVFVFHCSSRIFTSVFFCFTDRLAALSARSISCSAFFCTLQALSQVLQDQLSYNLLHSLLKP